MGRKRAKAYGRSAAGGALWTALFFLVILAVTLAGLANAGRAVRASGLRAAEEAVRRAAVTCYAIEGAYPESYEYLKEHYGVRVDERLYAVHYSVFASNVMPDIAVRSIQ
jgi:hypothetical protein